MVPPAAAVMTEDLETFVRGALYQKNQVTLQVSINRKDWHRLH